MYRGFNLLVPDNCFAGYRADGQPIHAAQKERIDRRIGSFKDADGSLIGSKLSANWFPEIDAQVFIAHAHKDSELAIRCAGFLKYEFDITAFIDSCVWGYAGELLRLLDDEYCWQPQSKTYNYAKRNRSTAHVHMMLSTALSRMLDKCESVIFLNTPSSISSADYINSNTTDSPWIYTEISMTRLIERRSRSDHRRIIKSAARVDEALRIKYEVDLEHLTVLTTAHLSEWKDAASKPKSFDALDLLYATVP